ncbi:hypothetical protein BDR03DRAFT_955149 [Suillus americanus]|nr:hypothetical protein BDR03DRAFT_955149 [Suillus americanus]
MQTIQSDYPTPQSYIFVPCSSRYLQLLSSCSFLFHFLCFFFLLLHAVHHPSFHVSIQLVRVESISPRQVNRSVLCRCCASRIP